MADDQAPSQDLGLKGLPLTEEAPHQTRGGLKATPSLALVPEAASYVGRPESLSLLAMMTRLHLSRAMR